MRASPVIQVGHANVRSYRRTMAQRSLEISPWLAGVGVPRQERRVYLVSRSKRLCAAPSAFGAPDTFLLLDPALTRGATIVPALRAWVSFSYGNPYVTRSVAIQGPSVEDAAQRQPRP